MNTICSRTRSSISEAICAETISSLSRVLSTSVDTCHRRRHCIADPKWSKQSFGNHEKVYSCLLMAGACVFTSTSQTITVRVQLGLSKQHHKKEFYKDTTSRLHRLERPRTLSSNFERTICGSGLAAFSYNYLSSSNLVWPPGDLQRTQGAFWLTNVSFPLPCGSGPDCKWFHYLPASGGFLAPPAFLELRSDNGNQP